MQIRTRSRHGRGDGQQRSAAATVHGRGQSERRTSKEHETAGRNARARCEHAFVALCKDIVIIGLTTSRRGAGQEEEETRRDTSTVLILQELSFIAELFKVIQDAILLIQLYRTMLLFRATSSSTFIMSDVQNQFTFHHQFGIDTWRSKFEQQRYSILPACGSHGQKIKRILRRLTWLNRVMHNTCIKHGRDIRTQCVGSTSILL